MTLFLHVDRAGLLGSGDKIKLQPRPGESGVLAYGRLFADGFPEHIENLCRAGLSSHGIQYLIHLFDKDQHAPLIFKELFLEFIRFRYAVDEPSRFQSMFAWGSYEDARAFADEIKRPVRILEVEPLGRVLKADINLSRQNPNDKTALSYWCGNRLDNGQSYVPRWEYVLELPVRVIREMEPA